MNASRRWAAWTLPDALLLAVCIVLYLLIFALGNPPSDRGSEPAWTEVLAWSFLHGAQWGKDIVYTYGPLAFLQPYTFYVDGIYVPFVTGQVLLPLAFMATIIALFRGSRPGVFALFVIAYVCGVLVLPGDVAWAMTMLFGTVSLIDHRRSASWFGFHVATAALAAVFAVLALSKFTLVPIWVGGVGAICASLVIDRRTTRAAATAALFVAALLLAWIASGQHLANLVPFLVSSSAIAASYGHAMGLHAPFAAECAGIAVLVAFVAACVRAAWLARHAGLFVALLAALSAVLFWRAFFTRGDHWPWFFAALALLPFVVLRTAAIPADRALRGWLTAIVLASSIASLAAAPAAELPDLLWSKIHDGVANLGRLRELGVERASQWRQLAATADLPRTRALIGTQRVDALTWEQAPALLNGFNLSTRPIIQSHVASTAQLARINADHYESATAPEFVMLKLDAMDRRLPLSEDPLVMALLLQHYRPRIVEAGFLVLERDRDAVVAPGSPAVTRASSRLGATLPVEAGAEPLRATIGIELNSFGKLYTLLFREPALNLTLGSSDGSSATYRLVRGSAAAGFVLSPALQSGTDWVHLYLGLPLPAVASLRVDTETQWDRLLFDPAVAVTLQPIGVLHDTVAGAGRAVSDMIYPGFNLVPEGPVASRVIVERGRDALFLHAPASLVFRPDAGNYAIRATVGIEDMALTDANCLKRKPDGVGLTLLRHHQGQETPLWQRSLDPFHVAADKGPQPLDARFIDVLAGDTIEYRVDAGAAGETSCDWSYAYGFVFRRLGEAGSGEMQRQRVFKDGFE